MKHVGCLTDVKIATLTVGREYVSAEIHILRELANVVSHLDILHITSAKRMNCILCLNIQTHVTARGTGLNDITFLGHLQSSLCPLSLLRLDASWHLLAKNHRCEAGQTCFSMCNICGLM